MQRPGQTPPHPCSRVHALAPPLLPLCRSPRTPYPSLHYLCILCRVRIPRHPSPFVLQAHGRHGSIRLQLGALALQSSFVRLARFFPLHVLFWLFSFASLARLAQRAVVEQPSATPFYARSLFYYKMAIGLDETAARSEEHTSELQSHS